MAPKKRPAGIMAPKKRPAAAAVTASGTKRPAAATIAAKKPASRQDSVSCPHSVANFWEALVTSLELHLKVDFQRQLFSGDCKLVVDKLKPGVCDVVLDVLHLAIHSITDEGGRLLLLLSVRAGQVACRDTWRIQSQVWKGVVCDSASRQTIQDLRAL